MSRKLRALALVTVLLASLVGSVAVIGNVAAAGNALADETVNVDEDTNAVQVLVETTTGTLNVTVYGVDDAGNETQVATGTVSATSGPNATDTYKYSALDPANYSQYRVTVDGDAAELIEIAKVQTIPAGGGLLGDGGPSALEAAIATIGIVAVIGAAAIWGRR